ncbi:hypothetical protein PMAYCL1PPCAC_06731, partial [Pristionchus mayeri]
EFPTFVVELEGLKHWLFYLITIVVTAAFDRSKVLRPSVSDTPIRLIEIDSTLAFSRQIFEFCAAVYGKIARD